MNQKKALKTFSVIFLVLVVAMLSGKWLIFDINIFNITAPQSRFVEDLGEYTLDDIIPTFYYADVRQGEMDIRNVLKKCSEKQKEEIISSLKKTKYRGITKKEKKEWIGKKYPKDKTNIIKLYAFFPSEDSNEIIYGPDMYQVLDIGLEVPPNAHKNITLLYVIKEQKTGRAFLALYYEDTKIKSESKKDSCSYYLLEDSKVLDELEEKLQKIESTSETTSDA